MAQKTVLITGASSGIGMEFARAFSKMGYRLILSARRKDRLVSLARELKTPCRILLADLESEVECIQLCKKIKDEQIDIFINNAGFGACGGFTDVDFRKEVSMMHVNILSMHILFKYVLKKMEKRGRGRILNVASSAGLLPGGPYMATYYASKAYVVNLTRAVAYELKKAKSKIYVGAVCPGPVNTEFNERADVKFSLPGISPKQCVYETLQGMKERKVIIIPSKLMRASAIAQKILPTGMVIPIVAKMQKLKK